MTSVDLGRETGFTRGQGSLKPSDVILGLAVVATSGHGLWVWQIGYSPTRDLIVTYLLTGLGIAFAYWKRLRRPSNVLVTVWLAATWIGFLSWLVAVGSNIASNTWREWLLSSAFLVFGVALSQRWNGWQRVFVWFALSLGAYQILALVFARDRLSEILSGPGEFYSDRPMSAGLALILVLGFVILMSGQARITWQCGVAAAFLGISAIISQHRSVWVALIVAVVVLTTRAIRGSGYTLRWFTVLMTPLCYAALSVVLSATVSVSLLPGGSVSKVAGVGVPEAATNTSTLSWRLEMWQSRLMAPRSLMDWLTGGVFGVNPVKWPGAGVMNGYVSGHSMVVDTLTMYGLLGLVVLAGLFWIALRSPGVEGVFLWAAAGFGLFYTLPSWSWVVLGVALAAANAPSPARTTARSVDGAHL